VPQTAGTTTSALDLAVDPTLGGIYILWQQDEGENATVNFASYLNDVWTGPIIIAGGDGTAAANPQMMLYRAVDQVEDLDEDGEPILDGNGEPILIEVATTFLHTSWWSYVETIGDGAAHYMPIPLDEDGAADFEAYDPIVLADLLPYGINCSGIEDAPSLAAPMIFSDPQSGFPHILAADFDLCLFYVLQLGHEVGLDPVTERRRHTIILRNGGTRHVDTRLPLANASVEVGRNLSLVLHWDEESSVDYMTMSEQGTSDVMSLTMSDALDREQAVELIRSLTR
jgi:hypothetical protein